MKTNTIETIKKAKLNSISIIKTIRRYEVQFPGKKIPDEFKMRIKEESQKTRFTKEIGAEIDNIPDKHISTYLRIYSDKSSALIFHIQIPDTENLYTIIINLSPEEKHLFDKEILKLNMSKNQ